MDDLSELCSSSSSVPGDLCQDGSMENPKNTLKLSCEQIYSVWATEPHIIRILDVRSADEYSLGHIPGSQNVQIKDLENIIDTLHYGLAVIVAHEESEKEIQNLLQGRDNYVFMSQCREWARLKKPMAGEGLQATISNFEQKQGVEMQKEILFQQLFDAESSTYTYIIADARSREAAIIDPVLENVDRDLKLIDELDLRLMYVLDTHIHADHVTGAGEIRRRTQAKTAVSQNANVDCVDIPLEDGQELLLGDKKIAVIATPGHTNTCMTYAFSGMIFTGDALLIRGCGRTDFQEGSSETLYDSVHRKLFQLPDETIIYPGHDYKGLTSSTVGLEKKHNPRLGMLRSKEEFNQLMAGLKLANPKKIHEAVPANLACGRTKEMRHLQPETINGIPEVSSEDVFGVLEQVEQGKIRLIDVRRPDEFNNELGHIRGAKLVTLGSELTQFLEKGNRAEEIVFVCRSGARSGKATQESLDLGYKFTVNMTGGMLRWNELQQPTEKS